MTTIKTAVSLQKPLFEQMEVLARKLNISRSYLFTLALKDFIRRHENQQLLEQINQAYLDTPDLAEQRHLRQMRHPHRKIVEGEW